MPNYLAVRTAADVTDAIASIVEDVAGDYLSDEYDQKGRLTQDMKETLWDKGEGHEVDGKIIELGNQFGTPAMKKMVKIAKKYLAG